MSNNFEVTVLKKLDNMDNKFTNMILENRAMIELNSKKISENKDMILANKNVILNLVKKVDENTKAIEDLSTVAYSAYKGYENNIGKIRKENKRLSDISEENQQEHQFFKKDLRSLHSKILNHNTRISLLEKIKKQKEEIKI